MPAEQHFGRAAFCALLASGVVAWCGRREIAEAMQRCDDERLWIVDAGCEREAARDHDGTGSARRKVSKPKGRLGISAGSASVVTKPQGRV